MNDHPITTEAIAELVRSHGTIPAPDVGRHFGQPYWTGEIQSAATPLIESGRITISAEHGVVWNHDGGDLYPEVPQELKARRQWVVWRNETRDGKPTKVPYQINGKRAQSNQLNTWTDYQTVCTHRARFSGIGFVFSKDDLYCGIDLDDCLYRDENGKIQIKPWAQPIVDMLTPVAYGEVSPSGTGIKFWTKATLPPDTKHRKGVEDGEIEVYDQGRYFTVTGIGKGEIADGQAVIDWLVQEHLSEPQRPTGNRQPSATENLNDGEVIERIRASKQCHKFDALMAGNTTGYGSQSEADLGLCGVIAFYTQDHAVIDSIFRTSGLMRPKWDEKHTSDGKTYGEMTIAEALSGERETYTRPRKTYRRSLTATIRRNL